MMVIHKIIARKIFNIGVDFCDVILYRSEYNALHLNVKSFSKANFDAPVVNEDIVLVENIELLEVYDFSTHCWNDDILRCLMAGIDEIRLDAQLLTDGIGLWK